MTKLSGGGRAGGGGTDGGAKKRDILHRTHERAHIHTRAGGGIVEVRGVDGAHTGSPNGRQETGVIAR